jgi:hypothetical protein
MEETMEQGERESIVNYLKSCISDAVILTLDEDEEVFGAMYDALIHSELAKKLHIQDLRELHLTYLMLINTFNRNGFISIH